MIGGHGQLNAIFTGLSSESQRYAGIVYQHIDFLLIFDNVGGEFAHRFLRAQIQFLDNQLIVAGLLDNFLWWVQKQTLQIEVFEL